MRKYQTLAAQGRKKRGLLTTISELPGCVIWASSKSVGVFLIVTTSLQLLSVLGLFIEWCRQWEWSRFHVFSQRKKQHLMTSNWKIHQSLLQHNSQHETQTWKMSKQTLKSKFCISTNRHKFVISEKAAVFIYRSTKTGLEPIEKKYLFVIFWLKNVKTSFVQTL